MIKNLLIVVLGLLFCNVGFAELINLKCKFDDGSGDELFMIDWDNKKILWNNGISVEEFIISGPPSDETKFNAFSKDRRIIYDKKKYVSKTAETFKISVDLLHFNLWDMVHNQSTKAQVYHSQAFSITIFKDKDNLILMPSKDDLSFLPEDKLWEIGNDELGTSYFGNINKFNCNKI